MYTEKYSSVARKLLVSLLSKQEADQGKLVATLSVMLVLPWWSKGANTGVGIVNLMELQSYYLPI
jgi:hypothetical protein